MQKPTAKSLPSRSRCHRFPFAESTFDLIPVLAGDYPMGIVAFLEFASYQNERRSPCVPLLSLDSLDAQD